MPWQPSTSTEAICKGPTASRDIDRIEWLIDCFLRVQPHHITTHHTTPVSHRSLFWISNARVSIRRCRTCGKLLQTYLQTNAANLAWLRFDATKIEDEDRVQRQRFRVAVEIRDDAVSRWWLVALAFYWRKKMRWDRMGWNGMEREGKEKGSSGMGFQFEEEEEGA